jgi:CSLREA domain-containing protein
MASLDRVVKGLTLLLVAAATLVAPSAALAATIDVTTTSDEFNANGGTCSLREAIWAANNDSAAQAPGCTAGSGLDTVEVPGGTYDLTRPGANENADASGDLDVSAPATITHTGPGSTVVDGKGLDRVFHTFAAGGVTISDLVIEGGVTPAGTSGGGILNSGVLTVDGSTITGNSSLLHGGGMENNGTPATLDVNDSTVVDNQAADDGGGVDVTGGHMHLVNVTISGNLADSDRNGSGDGGGIGVFVGQVGIPAFFSTHDTIDAANTDSGGQSPDCVSQLGVSFSSQGQTLIGNPAGCSLVPGSGDIYGRGAKLGPLDDNGGPTPTEALLRGSPALNKGTTCVAYDQRGVPRSLGGACDIGAYELVRCKGRAADVVGTNSNDVLTGSAGADVFLMLGGDDKAFGLGGDDVFCGGAGRDNEYGGSGRDVEYGDTGADNLVGGPGNDKLVGGGGKDELLGDGGRDKLVGGRSRDLCNGGSGRRDRALGCESLSRVP